VRAFDELRSTEEKTGNEPMGDEIKNE
jgi:hypothetical protein